MKKSNVVLLIPPPRPMSPLEIMYIFNMNVLTLSFGFGVSMLDIAIKQNPFLQGFPNAN